MSQDQLKQAVADAALEYIRPLLENDSVIGIGTGSTANLFIDALASIKGLVYATVASSEASAERLKSHGIPVYDLNTVNQVDFYIDGADESNAALQLIKGGGAALTREKIVAAVAGKFICIADDSSQRHIDPNVLSGPAYQTLAPAVLSILGAKAVLVLKDEQGAQMRRSPHIHVSALAALATCGPPERNPAFTAKGDAAVAATPRFDLDLSLIKKQIIPPSSQPSHRSTRL